MRQRITIDALMRSASQKGRPGTLFFGSSRFPGKASLDFEEEVGGVAKAIAKGQLRTPSSKAF